MPTQAVKLAQAKPGDTFVSDRGRGAKTYVVTAYLHDDGAVAPARKLETDRLAIDEVKVVVVQGR